MTRSLERLERFVGTWEPSLAREFLDYDRLLRAKSHAPPGAWGETGSYPYWLELPRWLTERRGNGGGTVSPEFLDTVLWGQTSLFYAVRIQDDLADGQLPRTVLPLATLLFLSEAHRAYSSVTETTAAFWNHYWLALRTTVGGIVRVADMQRNLTASADELLQGYGCVDAIFSVAPTAVCERMGAAEEIPRLNEFVSELGKVLLALDDAEDIAEDLADGRLNYPARILLEGNVASEADLTLLAKTWRLHARAEGFAEIRKALLDCLARARRAIAPLGLPPAILLIDTTSIAVQNLPTLQDAFRPTPRLP